MHHEGGGPAGRKEAEDGGVRVGAVEVADDDQIRVVRGDARKNLVARDARRGGAVVLGGAGRDSADVVARGGKGVGEAAVGDAGAVGEAEVVEEDDAEAVADLTTAKIAREQLKSQAVALEVKKEDVELAKQQVKLDGIDLRNAQQQMDYTTILAPMDGVIADLTIQTRLVRILRESKAEQKQRECRK